MVPVRIGAGVGHDERIMQNRPMKLKSTDRRGRGGSSDSIRMDLVPSTTEG
jgi:hypothetical protein